MCIHASIQKGLKACLIPLIWVHCVIRVSLHKPIWSQISGDNAT